MNLKEVGYDGMDWILVASPDWEDRSSGMAHNVALYHSAIPDVDQDFPLLDSVMNLHIP
jgi:hypothetical protein